MNEDLVKVASWCRKRAAWLQREKEVNLGIDPDWHVELKGEALDDTIKGLEQMAKIFDAIRQGTATP
jgi:hypothetical protein